jgi:hypothetical protein
MGPAIGIAKPCHIRWKWACQPILIRLYKDLIVEKHVNTLTKRQEFRPVLADFTAQGVCGFLDGSGNGIAGSNPILPFSVHALYSAGRKTHQGSVRNVEMIHWLRQSESEKITADS